MPRSKKPKPRKPDASDYRFADGPATAEEEITVFGPDGKPIDWKTAAKPPVLRFVEPADK